LAPGGAANGKEDEYGFFAKDGTIPLPQNASAYIVAMGEEKGQLYFGLTELTTSLKMNPELEIQVATKEQINVRIQKLGLKDLKVDATDSKNADKIRKIDEKIKQLESMKPKNCDCDCHLVMEDKKMEAIETQ
jgi:hypothetical protein